MNDLKINGSVTKGNLPIRRKRGALGRQRRDQVYRRADSSCRARASCGPTTVSSSSDHTGKHILTALAGKKVLTCSYALAVLGPTRGRSTYSLRQGDRSYYLPLAVVLSVNDIGPSLQALSKPKRGSDQTEN